MVDTADTVDMVDMVIMTVGIIAPSIIMATIIIVHGIPGGVHITAIIHIIHGIIITMDPIIGDKVTLIVAWIIIGMVTGIHGLPTVVGLEAAVE